MIKQLPTSVKPLYKNTDTKDQWIFVDLFFWYQKRTCEYYKDRNTETIIIPQWFMVV